MTDIDRQFDEIDALAQDELARRRKQASITAAGRNPDQFAKANSLSDRLNLPVDVVHDNLPDYEAEDRETQFATLGRDHPETHDFLADPRRRTLVQDDPQGLGNLARTLKFGRTTVVLPPLTAESGNGNIPLKAADRVVGEIYTDKRGMPRRWTADGWQGGDLARNSTLAEKARGMALSLPIGATNAVKSIIDLASLLSGVDTTAEFDAAFRESNEFYESLKPAAYRAEQTPIVQRDSAGGIAGLNMPSVESVADAITTSIPQIPLFLGTGGGLKGMADAVIPNSPKLAAFLGYGTANAALVAPGQRQDTMAQVRSEGGTEEQAQSAGNKAGILTGLLTAVTGGTGATLAGLQGQQSRYIVQAMLRGFVADAPLEGVEEAGQSAINDVAQGKRINSADALDQGLLAAVSGGLPGSAIASIEYTARLQEITRAAKAAKIGERSPADAEAFADAVAGDQRVYIKASDAKTLFQSEALAELVGDDLSEQMASGDVSIPMSKWVSIVSRLPNADEIVRHSRMHPDGLSAIEIEQQDATEAELFGKPQEETKPDTRQQIVEDVTAQLVATNRYTPAQAEAQAKLWGAAIGTMAERAGMDAAELYQRYMGGIGNGTADQSGAVTLNQQAFTAKTKAGQFRLTDELAVPGADYSEFGQFREVVAYDGETRIGSLLYANDGTPPTVEVEPEYRRKGVATAMLKLAKQQGGVLGDPNTGISGKGRPTYRTDDGQAFRSAANEDSVTIEPETGDAAKSLAGRAVDAVKTLFQSKPKSQTETKEFKRWFGDSKVVDANGEPLVLYHGTSKKFSRVNMKRGAQGVFWLTSDKAALERGEVGAQGQGVIMEMYAKIEKPAGWKEYDKFGLAELEARGYDGIILPNSDGTFDAVIFEPTQVKSATANRGTFDPADPNILRQGKKGAGPRGQIDIFPDRKMSISLFAGADKTTFIHESGHFFFEVFRDIATAEGAPAEVRADFDAALKFMGVGSVEELNARAAQADVLSRMGAFRELTDAEKAEIDELNEPLEKFARGFEAYAAEGKAPTPELRSVFAQFKAWILSVYRNLKALNVELTPEVRGVFDRMLASNDEIEAAQVKQGMAPLATTAAEAKALGLTEKQFADYIRQTEEATEEAKADVFNKLNKAWERERLAWWKEERAKVRQELADQYEATPAVRALRILSGAKSVDGVELAPPLAGMKLDRAAIVAEYGDFNLPRFGRTYAKSGGVHPDEAASVLGFTSGDHLLKALANAPDTIARVDSEADAIMRERHGDPMTDGALAEKAMTAVHGNKRVQLLERELEILAKLAGQPAPERRILNAIAERRVAAKTARQLRPNEYLSAERRAAREAIKAAGKGDYAAAMVAKRQQAVNVALYSAAIKAREQFDKNLRYLQRIVTTDARSRIGKAGADYLEQVDALLESVELKQVSGRQVERRMRLAEWVAKQEAAGNPISVPAKTLAETGLTNLRDMAHDDVQGIVDTIKQIEHLAKTKTKLMLAGVERDRDEVDAELAASVFAAHGVRPERTGDQTAGERARQFVSDVDIARLLPTNIARELDGYEEGGAVWSNVIAPIRKAIYERVIPAMHQMQEAVSAIYSKHYTPAEIRKIDQPVWRAEVNDNWSKGRILSLAMNWGSEGNREAILSQARSKITEAQAVALLRTLDARDWQFVQDMVDKVNSYWPEVAETKRRRSGLVPPKVEAQPFTIETASGEVVPVRGGYMRLYYDSDRSGYGSKQKEIENAFDDLRGGRASGAMTKNGATIERVGSAGQTVDLSVDTPIRAMRETIRDLYLGDAVNYVANTLSGHDFKSAITDVGMQDHLSALELWLKDVATGELGPRNGLESVVKFARQNTTAAMMTYKVSSAALQVTGIIQSAVVIGNRAMLQGVVRLMSKSWIGPHSVWNDIREKSPFMRERFGQVVEAVEDQKQQREGYIKGAHSGMLRWGYIPMARVQMIADAATWLAGERVGLKKFNGDADKARAFADDLVIRAQSPDNFIDKSSISRGTLGENHRQSEYVKATTMLLSYMIAKGNVAREKYQATSFTSPQQVMRFSVDMVQLFALEAIIMGLVRNGLPDDEDDDGIADDWIAYLLKEMALGPLATIPLLSQLATEGRGYTSQGVMERSWGQVEGAASEWADDELGRSDLKALVNVTGILTGIPSSQINTTADALWRVHDGEDVTPIDYVIRPEKPRE